MGPQVPASSSGRKRIALQPAALARAGRFRSQRAAQTSAFRTIDLGARAKVSSTPLFVYPLSRALYNAQPRFPLALDLAVSRRLADRLVATAHKASARCRRPFSGPWRKPPSPACESNRSTAARARFPAPTTGGSQHPARADRRLALFADIEAKAAFWQRSRDPISPRSPTPAIQASTTDEPADVQSLIEDFRVANTNLREIWSLVLPPQSLLGLKKLSLLRRSLLPHARRTLGAYGV